MSNNITYIIHIHTYILLNTHIYTLDKKVYINVSNQGINDNVIFSLNKVFLCNKVIFYATKKHIRVVINQNL